MRTFCVHHFVFNISHRLRPCALKLPPWWSSIVPPRTALPHHTSSTNLCALLSLSRAFPKPIQRRPHPFRTPPRIVRIQRDPSSFFSRRRCERINRIFPTTTKVGPSSPSPWVSGEATLKRIRVSHWGTVNFQRSTLAAQQAPSFLTLRKTRLNLVTRGH